MLADFPGDNIALRYQVLGLITGRYFLDDLLYGRVNDDGVEVTADIVHQIIGGFLIDRVVYRNMGRHRLKILG
ncbi:hypothetical protein D3C76_1627530 [compost metagenome]